MWKLLLRIVNYVIWQVSTRHCTERKAKSLEVNIIKRNAASNLIVRKVRSYPIIIFMLEVVLVITRSCKYAYPLICL